MFSICIQVVVISYPDVSGRVVYIRVTSPSDETYELYTMTDDTGAYSEMFALTTLTGNYTVTAFWTGDNTLLHATSDVASFTVSSPGIPWFDTSMLIGIGIGIVGALVLAFVFRRK